MGAVALLSGCSMTDVAQVPPVPTQVPPTNSVDVGSDWFLTDYAELGDDFPCNYPDDVVGEPTVSEVASEPADVLPVQMLAVKPEVVVSESKLCATPTQVDLQAAAKCKELQVQLDSALSNLTQLRSSSQSDVLALSGKLQEVSTKLSQAEAQVKVLPETVPLGQFKALQLALSTISAKLAQSDAQLKALGDKDALVRARYAKIAADSESFKDSEIQVVLQDSRVSPPRPIVDANTVPVERLIASESDNRAVRIESIALKNEVDRLGLTIRDLNIQLKNKELDSRAALELRDKSVHDLELKLSSLQRDFDRVHKEWLSGKQGEVGGKLAVDSLSVKLVEAEHSRDEFRDRYSAELELNRKLIRDVEAAKSSVTLNTELLAKIEVLEVQSKELRDAFERQVTQDNRATLTEHAARTKAEEEVTTLKQQVRDECARSAVTKANLELISNELRKYKQRELELPQVQASVEKPKEPEAKLTQVRGSIVKLAGRIHDLIPNGSVILSDADLGNRDMRSLELLKLELEEELTKLELDKSK